MSRATLLARRSTAHRGLLALVWLLVAVLTGALGITVGWTQAAATAGARDGTAAADPSGRALQLAARLAEGSEADTQDAQVQQVLAELLDGVPHQVAYDVRTEPQYTTDGEGQDLGRWTLALLPAPSRAEALAGAGAESVTVVDGAWPAGQDEAAVQADAAEAAGLAVGDTVRLGVDPERPTATGTPVTVAATWQVTDADDAVWLGDPVTLTGTDGAYPGPVVVSQEVMAGLDTDPFARWTVVPDDAALTPAELPALAALTGEVESTLGEDTTVAPRGLTVSGTLSTTAADLGAALRAADAVALVPLCLLALVGLVALVQVARLLAATREGEVALLVSRGAAPGTVTAAAAVEGALLALTAAAAGGGAAWGALRIVARTDAGAAVSVVTPLVVALAVAVVATATLVLVAALQAQAAVRRQVTDRSGRVRQVAALGTVVLTVAAAAVSVTQLLRYGSPLLTTPDGPRTDPAAAAAPALALAALAVAAMAVLGPATRLWAGLAGRSRGAGGPLAARQVARRLVVYVVPVVLLVLAGGAASLAGGYAGTAERLRADVDVLANGADVRVVAPESGTLDPAPYLPGGQGPGAAAAAAVPVLSGTAYSDSRPVTLLAVPAAAVSHVVRAPAEVLDVGQLGQDLASEGLAEAPALPDGARDVALTMSGRISQTIDLNVQAGAPAHQFDVSLVLAAPDGTLTTVELGQLVEGDGTGGTLGEDTTTHELSGQVPAPPEGQAWRVAALDLDTTPGWSMAEATLSLKGLTAGGEPVAVAGWTPSETLDGADGLELNPDASSGGAELTMPLGDGTSGASRLRLLTTPAAGPVPLLASSSLADALDVAPGDTFEVTLSGTRLPVVAVATSDTVPGALEPYAALLDRGALAAALVREVSAPLMTSEVWLAAGPPGAAAPAGAVARLAQEATAEAETTAASSREQPTVTVPGYGSTDSGVPVRVSFWLAAAGATVLALAGVLAVAVATLRDRRGEVIVLRAVGLGPAAQARARTAELIAVGLVALVVGAVAGWAVARFTVGGLAAATLTGIDAAPPARFVVETAGTGLVVAAALAGLVLVAIGVGGRVAAQARDTTYREEVR
ncbi:FtsX-like permease family protein [Promicromonospora panici]|uniref:FtsX-like permease family protein n=1 Tax=Promicromonospora panici TaxID=2219658 RepID=UPI00101D5709|nr:FtsX-like permease family protein [Promicromonospora panici]